MATESYSSNQFYNFGDKVTGYEPGSSINRTDRDNPNFSYPGNLIPNIYDAPNNLKTDTTVQRGFIRGIYPEIMNELNKDVKNKKKYSKLKDAPVRRCFFQFNPSMILRSVDASSSTLNALLQSPNQILQPITGQSVFEFELLFNREREVSNQMYYNTGNDYVTAKPLTGSLDLYGNDNSKYGTTLPFSQDQVGDLGVLLDLYVLDSIIGQSITYDMIETIQKYWDATKDIRATTGADGETTNPFTDTDFLAEDFKNKLGSVLGNSTFLNPMPIRIVFSSLFMVEGFVTSSRVAFHKFTKTMVPTVCQVTLSVQALYIGFAKKDTYISQMLREGISTSNTHTTETEGNRNAAAVLLDKYVHLSLSYLRGYTFPGVLATGYSLNSWYQAVTSANKNAAFFRSTAISNLGSADDQKGLKIWIDDEYRKGIGGTIQDIKVNFIRLSFIDIAKLPKHLATQTKFKQYVEKNGLSQMARYGSAIISTVQVYNDTNKKQLRIDSKDIEKLKAGEFYSTVWESSPITAKNRPSNAFFGTGKIAIVMEVSMSAGYKDYNGDVLKDLVTLKTSILWNFDPTSTTDYTRLHSNNGNFSNSYFSTDPINVNYGTRTKK